MAHLLKRMQDARCRMQDIKMTVTGDDCRMAASPVDTPYR
jgi:hypothetical protein